MNPMMSWSIRLRCSRWPMRDCHVWFGGSTVMVPQRCLVRPCQPRFLDDARPAAHRDSYDALHCRLVLNLVQSFLGEVRRADLGQVLLHLAVRADDHADPSRISR